MSDRITVVFDADMIKKLRHLQAKQITEESKSVSFSRVVNNQLRKSFDKIKSHK